MSIHVAVRKNLINEVMLILSNGGNVNEKSLSHYTPLHISISDRNIEMTKILLNYHPDFSIGDDRGMNALHYAAFYDLFDIVKLILSQDISIINKVDNYGNNPLWTAVLLPNVNYKMVQLLLENGADIHQKNKKCLSPADASIRKNDKELMQIFGI